MDNNTSTLPNGIMYKLPHQNAPDFVKGSLSIKKREFYEWMKTQPQDSDWINLDIKVSKEGKGYIALNTWKPNQQGQPQAQQSPFSGSSQQPAQPVNLGNDNGFDSINTDFDVSGFGDKKSENTPF